MANAKYIFSEMQNKYTVNRVTAVQVRWVRLSLAKFVRYERAFIISSSIVPLSPPIRRYPFLSLTTSGCLALPEMVTLAGDRRQYTYTVRS